MGGAGEARRLNWIANLATPYGLTTFQHVDNGFTNSDGSFNTNIMRSIRVVDAAGGTNIHILRNHCSFVATPPVPNISGALFDYWGGHTVTAFTGGRARLPAWR